MGGRVGYAKEPLDVTVAWGQCTLVDSSYAGTTDAAKIVNVGASYDFGVVKLSGKVSRSKYERADAVASGRAGIGCGRRGLLGRCQRAGWPGADPSCLLARRLRLQPGGDPFAAEPAKSKASKLALGYLHNLSKRMALYATLSSVGSKKGASLTANGAPAFISNAAFSPRTSTGYDPPRVLNHDHHRTLDIVV